ncbi:polyribonucleotide nucleotidyltransferase mitochondrial [Haematococcus lacustris]|uniref:Polyribonucleotide nucleotidyltransferase mitochondrial n=1 Tax=Haematococcus lacustris TaxID=44745 RepID=A0A6A0AID9_HAELA|nr:polyribonucleotide nucleotidyltransferase mitochondrial [Haematococcus lacustris]
MDFKVAGSRAGVTALQLDIKQPGLDPQVLVTALAQAKQARLQLLDTMEAALAAWQQARPGAQRSEAGLGLSGGEAGGPWLETLQIDKDNVPLLSGVRGLGLETLQESSGARLIYAPTAAALAAAKAAVQAVEGTDMQEGQEFDARVNDLREVMHEGDITRVKCLGRDLRGLVRLSRKALLPVLEPVKG